VTLSFISASWTPEPWQATVLSLLILALLPSEYLYRHRGHNKSSMDPHSATLLHISSVVNLAVIIWAVRSGSGKITWQPALVSDIGLLMAALGVTLRYWSILTLGKFFTGAVVIQSEQQVIRRGPFRWVRHPSYAGALLFGSGCALACVSGLGAAFYLVVHGMAFWYRSKVEEAVLSEHFGDAYREYQAVTWRFFPLIPG
jgi:protein-S-isoprenylcysteine O-methyltransferase